MENIIRISTDSIFPPSLYKVSIHPIHHYCYGSILYKEMLYGEATEEWYAQRNLDEVHAISLSILSRYEIQRTILRLRIIQAIDMECGITSRELPPTLYERVVWEEFTRVYGEFQRGRLGPVGVGLDNMAKRLRFGRKVECQQPQYP